MAGLSSNDRDVGNQYPARRAPYADRCRGQKRAVRQFAAHLAQHPDWCFVGDTAGVRWRLTRRLPCSGRLQLFRAAASGDLGPGCYVAKLAARSDSIGAAMLRREAAVAAEVTCPYLVSVVASQTDHATPHIVETYLDGVTLRRLIQWRADRGDAISMPLTLSVCRQIAAALAAMHRAGWLHGQVRPEHVIISPQGHATVIDLTEARRLMSVECMVAAGCIGSPIYAAPEMFSAGRQLTAAADLYSLGVLLFEALVGQPPFVGESLREFATLHRSERPPDLRRWRPDASMEVSELLWRMLAKEPLRRPSAEQAVRWLAELEIEELRTAAAAGGRQGRGRPSGA